MIGTVRKYNPGFLSDDELVASFCVRTREFASIVEALRESTGRANAHQIVIGPRGSGKTSLLLRVAAEIRRDRCLSSRFFPVVFAEESYEVSTAGEFWLECLSRLAEQAPREQGGPDLRRTFEDLRKIQDDRTLGDRCLGVLQDFSDREDKRIVLFVENLDMMFRDTADDSVGWRLRHALQNESRLLLLASATSRFDEIDNPERAFYDQVRVLTLRPLERDECATLWQVVSGQRRAPETIQSLKILTGGSPRLLAIVARFGANLSFRALMADLFHLIDDHTEYFKSHLEGLPPQERRVYVALIVLWKPATAREIAERARLQTSQCSAQLKRLVERGAVEVTGGTARRKLYYVAERLYNIYYLMRRSRVPDPLVEALLRFMEALYSPHELKNLGTRMAVEFPALDDKMQEIYRRTFSELTELNALQVHRDESRFLAPWHRVGGGPVKDGARTSSPAAMAFDTALTLTTEGREPEALAAWEELVHRFRASDAPDDRELVAKALVEMGTLFAKANRPEDALSAWDEAVHEFGSSERPVCLGAAASALLNKALMLGTTDLLHETVSACDEVLARFQQAESPDVVAEIAKAMTCKGLALKALSRPEEAIAVLDEVVQRFWSNVDPDVLESVASALLVKGDALALLDRWKDALTDWRRLVQRFNESEGGDVALLVTMAFAGVAHALVQLGEPDLGLGFGDEVIRRLKKDGVPKHSGMYARALTFRGLTLLQLDRFEDALETWEEVVRCFGSSDDPALQDEVSASLLGKSQVLSKLNRFEEAMAIYDEVVQRSRAGTTDSSLETVAQSLVEKGLALFHSNRQAEALAAWGEVVQRFGQSDHAVLREQAETALWMRATCDLGSGRMAAVIESANSILEREGMRSSETRCQWLVLRALALLAEGEVDAGARDVEAMLATFPTDASISAMVLQCVLKFAEVLDAGEMRDLILASPASERLLPITTALEKELGLEPRRVAKEVEEVAEDILRVRQKFRDGLHRVN